MTTNNAGRDNQELAKDLNLKTADQLPPWGKFMKAITVCQPYAHLIMTGAKRVENRTWPPHKAGLYPPSVVVIHAGADRSWWSSEKCYGLRQEDVSWRAAIALAYVTACVKHDMISAWCSADMPRRKWLLAHEHAHGPYCWIIDRVLPLKQPVPMRGFQGVWNCPSDLIAPYVDLCPEHGKPFCFCTDPPVRPGFS